MAGDRRAHAVDRPELGQQLGGGRRVVGDVVDRRAALGHHGGDAGVALCPHPLGQRLVGDLAHDRAAEAPPPAVDLQHPVGGQLIEVGETEVLAHRLGEPGQRADRIRGPEHGGVVDDRPLGHRQLIDARRDQSPQRSGQVRHRAARGSEGGQLDEEQGVAAAAVDEPGDDPLTRLVTVAAFEDPAHELGGIVDAERAEWHLEDERTFDRRRPHAVRIGPLPRDEQERQVRERADDHGELVAEGRIGPLQVVHPHHRHPGLSVAAQHVGHRHGDCVASPGGVEPVERRRVSQQVGDHIEVAAQLGVARLQSPQLLGAGLDDALDIARADVEIEVEQRRQPGDHRCPHAGLAVGRAGRAHHGRLTLQRLDDLVGEPGLAGAGLADDRHDAAVAVAHELHGGVHQRPLVDPPDERHVALHGPGARRRGAGDEPGVLVLLPPADAGDAERLTLDGLGAQGGGGRAHQHASRRSQRLQPRGGVDHVAHRRVVGAGQRADEHLAGVDADAHLDRGVGTGLHDEGAERLLHPQRGPHGPLRVVLVGDRRSEQGDDAVAEQLVDAAAEQLDVGDQPLEAGLDQALDVLRVAALGERGVADDVGEEDRDDPALLERDRRPCHRMPARGTEPSPRWHRMGARGARDHRHASDATAAVE